MNTTNTSCGEGRLPELPLATHAEYEEDILEQLTALVIYGLISFLIWLSGMGLVIHHRIKNQRRRSCQER